MSTPAQLIDPSTGVNGPPNGMLSPQERAAIERTEDPQNTIAEYRQARETQENWVDRVELERIQQENAQLREKMGQTTDQLQQYAQTTANLQGQLSQMNQQTLADRQAQEMATKYAWSEDELANHGELRPLIEREAERIALMQRQQIEQEFEQKFKTQLENSTAPLQEQLAQTTEQLQNQAAITKAQFDADMARSVQRLGLPNINNLVQHPEFTARFNQPFAPGDSRPWGEVLKQNILAQNLDATEAMLEDFKSRSQSWSKVPVADERPGGPSPRVPQTQQETQNMTERERLTAQLAKRQDDFIVGKLPTGETKAQYRAKNIELRNKIDSLK